MIMAGMGIEQRMRPLSNALRRLLSFSAFLVYRVYANKYLVQHLINVRTIHKYLRVATDGLASPEDRAKVILFFYIPCILFL